MFLTAPKLIWLICIVYLHNKIQQKSTVKTLSSWTIMSREHNTYPSNSLVKRNNDFVFNLCLPKIASVCRKIIYNNTVYLLLLLLWPNSSIGTAWQSVQFGMWSVFTRSTITRLWDEQKRRNTANIHTRSYTSDKANYHFQPHWLLSPTLPYTRKSRQAKN